MRPLSIIASILLGLVFIFSAYIKIYPIEPFEYSFVELGSGWKSSVFFARILIGLEFMCGSLLVFNLWLRRFTIPVVSAVLIIFTGYLILQLIKFGNTGNCGCFGDTLKMTPLEGILKNVAMLAVTAFIYVKHPGFDRPYLKFVAAALILTSGSLPFILNPVDFETSSRNYSGEINYKLDLDILYNDSNNAPPEVELREGKWVIAFFSLTCNHCRMAAKKLHLFKKRNPELPIHMILNGDKENLQPFFEDTRSENVSWSMFIGADKFIKMSGPQLPQILWVNNSMVENRTNYMLLSEEEVTEWAGKP